MRRIALIVLIVIFSAHTYAQSASQIKASKDYIWGEGKGETVRAADQMALQEMMSQISSHIVSEVNMSVKNKTEGQNVTSTIDYENVVKTYSSATLNNTQRLIISDEPHAQVLRYVKKSELDAIWKSRTDKVREFCRVAHQAYAQKNVGDALRYYYWANALLQSLPKPNEVSVEDESNTFQNASTWIPLRINEILNGVSVKLLRQESDNEFQLSFFIQGKPVANIDFTYFDGQDWSPVSSAQDGRGIAELRPGYKPESLKVKVEYQYFGESLSDKEVNSVINAVNEVTFAKSSKEVRLKNATSNTETKQLDNLQQKVASSVVSTGLSTQTEPTSSDRISRCQEVMKVVESTIRTKDYASIKPYCTDDGYKIFDRLIHYGNARIVGTPQYSFSSLDNSIYCRSLTLNFKFSHERTFIEDVAFMFNQDGKIDNIQFGLGKVATGDIIDKPASVMSDAAKVVLVNFLENYKTAYALKRVDYLESIFSDDALIITGKVVKQFTGNIEQGYRNNQRVQLTRMDKSTYIKGLRRVFASNEFVNLKFANNAILKSAKGGELYAIQIKQDYYSANYGDSGYLFLLVDLNDPDHPIIHVRAWQEMPDSEWGLIDLGTF